MGPGSDSDREYITTLPQAYHVDRDISANPPRAPTPAHTQLTSVLRLTQAAREIRPNYFISNFIQIFCQLYLVLSYFYQVFYQHCPSNIIKYHGFIHMNILNISLIYPSYINTFPDISSTFLFYLDISNTVL